MKISNKIADCEIFYIEKYENFKLKTRAVIANGREEI